LKPFISLAAYAERGLVPGSLLADTPLGLGGTAPRNFDRSYRGPVTAGRALSESLNAPAVRAARLVGESGSLSVLRKAGFRPVPGRVYGDSLVLGGMEVSLLELIEAYGILAREGRAARPVFERASSGNAPEELPSSERKFSKRPSSDPESSGQASSGQPSSLRTASASVPASAAPVIRLPDTPALDPSAVWLVNMSLRDESRLPAGLKGADMAFKTGTSHGMRDAWIMAWTPDHVLGIWLGSPSGESREGLTGLKALGPQAVSVMRALGRDTPWPDPPGGLERFRACPVSGDPVSPSCPDSVEAWRIKDGARTLTCRIHVREAGRVKLRWPHELAGFMRREGLVAAFGPSVASPAPGSVFRAVPGSDRIPFRSEGAYGTVHWYMDGEYVGASAPGKTPLVRITPGRHKVSMADGRGMSATSSFEALGPETSYTPVTTLE
jgi:penicillin-binding protein 1C